MNKKTKLLKKQVKYLGKTIELFSLDGQTWSSNQAELTIIHERLELMRNQFADKLVKSVTGESPAEVKATAEPETIIEANKKVKPDKLELTEEINEIKPVKVDKKTKLAEKPLKVDAKKNTAKTSKTVKVNKKSNKAKSKKAA